MPDEDYHATCYECDRSFSQPLPQREVMMDIPSGGYDMVSVPMCRDCIHDREGYPCPDCGLLHETADDAEYCCHRDPAEAPDCKECGRRMEVTAKGHDPIEGPSVTVAECEACNVGWGAFTGWFTTEGHS